MYSLKALLDLVQVVIKLLKQVLIRPKIDLEINNKEIKIEVTRANNRRAITVKNELVRFTLHKNKKTWKKSNRLKSNREKNALQMQ
jgi:hypothetical protein